MAAQETVNESGFSRLLQKTKRFFREVKAELKKVSWPDKKELSAYTGVVFISVLVVGALIWIIDAGFTGALKVLLK